MTLQVPFISEDVIENNAAALLAQYGYAKGVEVKLPIPIDDIVEKHLKLRVEFDDLHRLFGVPRSGIGPDIFGAIWLDSGRIVIDEALDPEEHPSKEGRYRFTLAHEGGGHWQLHRDVIQTDRTQRTLFGEVPSQTVVCRSSQAKERVEWQADYFASCLLMPRRLVTGVWLRRFGSLDPLNHGIIRKSVRVDPPRRPTFRHFGETVGETEYDSFADGWAAYFAPMFAVSTQAMRIRLEKLGLLIRDYPPQPLIKGIQ